MPQPGHLDPTAYDAAGGVIGALLIHGYTGSVAETRPLGEYLAARGMAIRCPLLPGHGTTPQDLTRIHRQQWVDEVEAALHDLQEQCQTVFVGGLSLGALLTLWLGATHPEIAGLIPMAPAIELQNRMAPLTVVLRYLLKYSPFGPLGDNDLGAPEAVNRIWCYDKLPMWGAAEVYLFSRRVRRNLGRIHQPVLIFQGRRDAQVTGRAAQIIHDGVASTDKTLVWLENSGHNLLADGQRETVWSQSYEWMMDRVDPHRRRKGEN
jgi:carboxylesterase